MNDWHHSPIHRLEETGAYIVTAGTYQKQHFFSTADRLTLLTNRLLDLAERHGWMPQAWAVFSNHYHLVATSPADAESLRHFINQLHWETAVAINETDGTPGRKIWFNYWEKRLTFERSYLARLNYVHYNPQKHQVCVKAEQYPWCSAGWFERKASPGFVRTVRSFRSDQLRDPDSFTPERIVQSCG